MYITYIQTRFMLVRALKLINLVYINKALMSYTSTIINQQTIITHLINLISLLVLVIRD